MFTKGTTRSRCTSLQCRFVCFGTTRALIGRGCRSCVQPSWNRTERGGLTSLRLSWLQIARLRLALNKQHTLMLQYIPKLAGEGFVFLSDLYDCPEPELEALLAKVEMKGPHAKLVRAALKAPQPPYNDEFAGFVERPELPPDDFPAAVIECLPQVSADRPWQVRNGNF